MTFNVAKQEAVRGDTSPILTALVAERLEQWKNPALWPLIYETEAADLLLVKIQPMQRPTTPRTALEIAERAAEISFNSALIGEMRAISFVKRLLFEERIDRGRYKDLRMHMISDEKELAQLPAQSKLDTSWDFLVRLRDLGRAAAQDWLERHRGDVGVRSSVDIQRQFLGMAGETRRRREGG